MKLIFSQPFVKVSRTIESNKQHIIEHHEMIHLYEDKIVAASKRFNLKDVLDMSSKSFSQDYWFLYLHTNQGVFSFLVKTEPCQFIHKFKRLK